MGHKLTFFSFFCRFLTEFVKPEEFQNRKMSAQKMANRLVSKVCSRHFEKSKRLKARDAADRAFVLERNGGVIGIQ